MRLDCALPKYLIEMVQHLFYLLIICQQTEAKMQLNK